MSRTRRSSALGAAAALVVTFGISANASEAAIAAIPRAADVRRVGRFGDSMRRTINTRVPGRLPAVPGDPAGVLRRHASGAVLRRHVSRAGEAAPGSTRRATGGRRWSRSDHDNERAEGVRRRCGSRDLALHDEEVPDLRRPLQLAERTRADRCQHGAPVRVDRVHSLEGIGRITSGELVGQTDLVGVKDVHDERPARAEGLQNSESAPSTPSSPGGAPSTTMTDETVMPARRPSAPRVVHTVTGATRRPRRRRTGSSASNANGSVPSRRTPSSKATSALIHQDRSPFSSSDAVSSVPMRKRGRR